MTVPQQAIDLIKKFDECRLKAYRDKAGIWTIGYGTTNGVTKGMGIKPAAAERMLADDLRIISSQVLRNVLVPLNANQLSALVSFVRNVGFANFLESSLLVKLNAGQYDSVPSELRKWTHAGGRVLPGLAVRRDAEAKLWSKEV